MTPRGQTSKKRLSTTYHPFIQKCKRSLSKQPADLPTNSCVVLPYVQGISKKIGRILRQKEVKVTYKLLKNCVLIVDLLNCAYLYHSYNASQVI